jgi:hypothetical protein
MWSYKLQKSMIKSVSDATQRRCLLLMTLNHTRGYDLTFKVEAVLKTFITFLIFQESCVMDDIRTQQVPYKMNHLILL